MNVWCRPYPGDKGTMHYEFEVIGKRLQTRGTVRVRDEGRTRLCALLEHKSNPWYYLMKPPFPRHTDKSCITAIKRPDRAPRFTRLLWRVLAPHLLPHILGG